MRDFWSDGIWQDGICQDAGGIKLALLRRCYGNKFDDHGQHRKFMTVVFAISAR
jgi:hypothetical protein